LRGEWRKGGWWYYYLYAIAVKVPLGVWVVGVLAAFLTLIRREYSSGWRDELVVLAPAAILLILVSSQTGFNHHLRYVLPIFPFAFIWLSKVARAFVFNARVLAVLAGTVVVWALASSLWIYPHNLSYFNEAAGGPENGHAHLVDSNIDWGQDVLYLKNWLEHHPEARPLGLAYFGAFDPRVAGIDFSLPPKGPTADERELEFLGPRPGWFAISVSTLRGLRFSLPNGRGGLVGGYAGEYTYFLHFQPVARAGYSIYIYHLTAEECDRAREQLGLPPLDPEPASP
jgi:hypothetical protein